MSAHTISRRNVNKIYEDGLWWLKVSGVVEDSRNGQVIVAPGPVLFTYHRPRERVLFSDRRDANPYFHFFEALWMLDGRQDLKFVADILPRMKEFSDDGVVLQGAYGHRWKKFWGFDQTRTAIRMLERDPDSRRVVISMWDAPTDLELDSRDLPCNTHLYVTIRQDQLDLTVCCRSNDAIWGAHGANAVHFSFLQEYLACALGKMVGKLHQFSNNYHVYPGMPRFETIWANPDSPDLYEYGADMGSGPLLFQGDVDMFDEELSMFLDEPYEDTGSGLLSGVAYPMWQSLKYHQRKVQDVALDWADKIDAPDWRAACVAWLTRRYGVSQ
jgi:hypothetical protein